MRKLIEKMEKLNPISDYGPNIRKF